MTREEAKEVFINRGYVNVKGGTIFDGDKWRQSVEVITEWLKEQPCADAVSRELVKKDIARWIGYIDEDMIARMHITIDKLPSVSTEKVGKWKKRMGDSRTTCPFCNALNFSKYKNYCPNCGAKMEVTE